MRRGPLSPAIKGIASGIGLISEYRHHRKGQADAKDAVVAVVAEEHALSATSSEVPTSIQEHSEEQDVKGSNIIVHEADEVLEDDEKQWDLDEVQDEIAKDEDDSKPKTPRDPTKMVQQFTAAHPPTQGFRPQRLSLPVVLPQRRPKDRTRGFIRAYAPALHECDINQEVFLQFIETLNAATLASPWLDAINLASLALVTLPTGISQAVSIAIAISVDITKNMQSRHRHSYVLDQMNNDFFRPRGLYALVLTWKPDYEGMTVGINFNETIADNLASHRNLFEKAKHSFRPSMGNTVGVAFAETAPLVFPVLDSLVSNHTSEAAEFKQKLKSAKGLIGDYFDRRAQAEHAGQHPDSKLAVTKPVFTSRYADPNHPSNNGDLLSLISGGRLSRPQRRVFLAQRMEGRENFGRFSRAQQHGSSYPADHNQQYGQGSSVAWKSQSQMADYGFGGRGLLGGSIKRVFQHHVVYLAIISMPTEAEMAEATAYLNLAQPQTQP